MAGFGDALLRIGAATNGANSLADYDESVAKQQQMSQLARLANDPTMASNPGLLVQKIAQATGDPSALVKWAEMANKRPEYKVQEINGQLVRYNPDDPNTPPQVIFGGTGGMNPKVVQGEGDLRKEFDGLNKDYRVVSDAYNKIAKTSQDPSAAGDLSLIFSYMKILDPGSTVREGEFATAQNAAGVPVQIQNLWNRAQNGERLAPEQRADFLNQAKNLYDAQSQNYESGVTKYRDLATEYGYNPDRIVKPLAKKNDKPLTELSTQELLARLKKK